MYKHTDAHRPTPQTVFLARNPRKKRERERCDTQIHIVDTDRDADMDMDMDMSRGWGKAYMLLRADLISKVQSRAKTQHMCA